MLFSLDISFFNVIIINTKGSAICQNYAPFFYDYIEKYNIYFPSSRKKLQSLTNHIQLKKLYKYGDNLKDKILI